MGRLTRDPEIRYTTTGKPVAQFTLAVNRNTKDADGNYQADFVPVVAWNKTAEICGDRLNKGRRAIVEGRLQVRSYEDKSGGQRWITEVIANSVEIVDWGEKQAAPASCMDGFAQPPANEEIPF